MFNRDTQHRLIVGFLGLACVAYTGWWASWLISPRYSGDSMDTGNYMLCSDFPRHDGQVFAYDNDAHARRIVRDYVETNLDLIVQDQERLGIEHLGEVAYYYGFASTREEEDFVTARFEPNNNMIWFITGYEEICAWNAHLTQMGFVADQLEKLLDHDIQHELGHRYVFQNSGWGT
jgi:hypothetical protein